MRIEHIAMYVKELEKTKDFFVTYFGAAANTGYHNPNTDFRSYFLTFDDGARLELMNVPEIADRGIPDKYPCYCHIAISLGSKDKVDALTERMRADGVVIIGNPRTTGDGYYESVVADPEGNIVELCA